MNGRTAADANGAGGGELNATKRAIRTAGQSLQRHSMKRMLSAEYVPRRPVKSKTIRSRPQLMLIDFSSSHWRD